MIGGTTQEVKLDILVGPLGAYQKQMKMSPPRARPKGNIEFHAHTVEEALHLEDQPTGVELDGRTSDGQSYRGTVFVPDAFPYLMMKLHAFGDRKEDANKDLGRHHALDAYTIVGMMTEGEYQRKGPRHCGPRKRSRPQGRRDCESGLFENDGDRHPSASGTQTVSRRFSAGRFHRRPRGDLPWTDLRRAG